MPPPLIYLDNAATTPVRPEVRDAMEPYLCDRAFGNPSSAHRAGRSARAAVETARRQVAAALGVEPSDVVFTSGGTEADNLAVLGVAFAARSAGRPFRVAVSAIEHKAVLEAAGAVTHLGGEAVVLPVDASGHLELESLDAALRRGVALVSAMWVNNETGMMQDITTIAGHCAAAGVPFHTDAVQAVGKVPCPLGQLPIALATISAHKVGGPKGVGALIVRQRGALEPLLHGGGQQLGIRPGTENVPGIVGMGKALELAVAELEETAAVTGALRDRLERRLGEAILDLTLNGAGGPRAPHISNVSVPGTDSESMMMQLDLAGIACSGGSACSTGNLNPSHVLTALGVPPQVAAGSLRFSFSKRNTPDDVDLVVRELPQAVARVRKLAEALRK